MHHSHVQGYSETWTNNGTRLICVEQPAGSRTTTIVVACVASVAGAAILFALLLVWLLYLRTKPRWLRERIMQGKRTCGAPKCTKPGDKVTVSIVVTDVKDFSELTRHYPELMSKAMGGHNNILRKACHAHAGYVLDQEGDSWAIAFHDAEDACAFSLQVCVGQQGLLLWLCSVALRWCALVLSVPRLLPWQVTECHCMTFQKVAMQADPLWKPRLTATFCCLRGFLSVSCA